MGSGREASTAGCGDTIALVLNCKLFDSSISNRQSFEEASRAIYLLSYNVFILVNDHVLLVSFFVNTHADINCVST